MTVEQRKEVLNGASVDFVTSPTLPSAFVLIPHLLDIGQS